jgi:hypothetical protein
MGPMKQLMIKIEEQVERMLDIQGIEFGSPAWHEYYLPLVDSLQRWVEREFVNGCSAAETIRSWEDDPFHSVLESVFGPSDQTKARKG